MIKGLIFCFFILFGSIIITSKGMAANQDLQFMDNVISTQRNLIMKKNETDEELTKLDYFFEQHGGQNCDGRSPLCDQINSQCECPKNDAKSRALSGKKQELLNEIANNQALYNTMTSIKENLIYLTTSFNQVNTWISQHNEFGVPLIKNGNCSSGMCRPHGMADNVFFQPNQVPCQLSNNEQRKVILIQNYQSALQNINEQRISWLNHS